MDTRTDWQRRIGVGEPCTAFTTAKGRSPRRRNVTVEEGPHRGTVGGYHTDHPDGRVDATVNAPTVTITPRIQGDDPS